MYKNNESVMADWHMYPLAITVSGSHIWKMDHEHSDIDICMIYVVDPITHLLHNTKECRSYKVNDNDVSAYNITHVVDQLKRGNITAYTQVLSPFTVNENGIVEAINEETIDRDFLELRRIARENIAKNSYHSIFGLAKTNMEIYFSIRIKNPFDDRTQFTYQYLSSRGETQEQITSSEIRKLLGLEDDFQLEIDPQQFHNPPKFTNDNPNFLKKINIIGRVLQFGINLLTFHQIQFEKTQFTKISEIISLFQKLNEAMDTSSLPETINETIYDEYLEKLMVKRCVKKIKQDYPNYL